MSVTSGVRELFLLSPSISVPPFSASAGPLDKAVLCSHNIETKEFHASHPCRQPPSICSHCPLISPSFCDSPSTPSCLASSPPSPRPPHFSCLAQRWEKGQAIHHKDGAYVCVCGGEGDGLRMPGAACDTLYIVCICVCLCLPCGYYPIFSFV